MQTFKLERNGLGKKILLRSLPTILVIVIVVTVMDVINGEFINLSRPITYVPQLVFFPCLIGFSLWWGVKKQKKLLESYELTISDKLICREQLNTPDISILVTEVVEIIKHPKGGFSIKGSRNNGTILIPLQIENYEQLETTLQQIHPITIKSHYSNYQKFKPLLGILGGGLMICVYAVNNKAVVGVAGSLSTALMIWSLVRTQKDKNIDRKTKNRAWIILIVIASITVSTILKLIA
jgi:hypothetical protein